MNETHDLILHVPISSARSIRTRGSELVEQGYRMEIVQRVLGHRDPRSTQGYAALHDDQVRAVLEQGGGS
jgi:hypothetical protein